MSSRRKFLGTVGKSALASSLPILHVRTKPQPIKSGQMEKNIRIGIIGAENSHTRGFGKLFNIDKAFPGVEVKYVWGETEAFAIDAMKRGGIPQMVKDPLEMMGEIDALIVDHRHAKYHLTAATPFVKAGIPTFVDKPFCYKLDEGREFLKMAREVGTPVTSFSSIAHSAETQDLRNQIQEIGEINQIIRSGPVDLQSEYGGVFFYGVHVIQPLLYMFDHKVEKVRINENGKNSGANLILDNGTLVTLVFTSKKYGWQTLVETDDGIVELSPRIEEPKPAKNYADMVEMFRTGKEPRSHEHILEGVAVLEALDNSVVSRAWEKVELI